MNILTLRRYLWLCQLYGWTASIEGLKAYDQLERQGWRQKWESRR